MKEISEHYTTEYSEKVVFTDEFLQQIREDITKQIGPIGSYIIDNILELNSHLTAKQLFEYMADEITKSYNIILTDKIFRQVREEIIKQIGPIGSYIIEDILEKNPHITPQELVELIEAEICRFGVKLKKLPIGPIWLS